jgi:hypothetical protein
MKKSIKISSSNYKIGSPLWKYARILEEQRGHNYQHLNDKSIEDLESKGYKFWEFEDGECATQSENKACTVCKGLKERNYITRVVTGLETNMQRIRMYSVIYKSKKTST